jgi:hypothetical protein
MKMLAYLGFYTNSLGIAKALSVSKISITRLKIKRNVGMMSIQLGEVPHEA